MAASASFSFSNRVSHFKVTLDEIEVADFMGAKGLAAVKEVLEYQEGGENARHHKIVGGTKWRPIVLSFGSSDSTTLFDWIKKGLQGTIERKNGAILALDQQGDCVARWEFMEAWPCAYSGPTFQGGESIVSIESLTLAHKGFVLKKGDVSYEERPGMQMVESEGGVGAEPTFGDAATGEEPSPNVACGKAGEPIDVVTGANVDEFVDFVVPGPIPITWRRRYHTLRNDHDGPMGWGFRHEYQHELRLAEDEYLYTNPKGEGILFQGYLAGRRELRCDGYRLRKVTASSYRIARSGQPHLFLEVPKDSRVARLKHVRRGQDWLQLRYGHEGNLRQIARSDGTSVRFESDERGRILEATLSQEGGAKRKLASYAYDRKGNLRTQTDPLGNSASYEYGRRHRMTKKTDRNGYAYHYEYDAEGRCVFSRGDDGLHEVSLEFHPDERKTVLTTPEGGKWTYHYDENQTIVQIDDPYAGRRKFITDDIGKVVQDIDPGGSVTNLLYDADGGHYARLDPWGYERPPLHLDPNPRNPRDLVRPASTFAREAGGLPREADVEVDPLRELLPESLHGELSGVALDRPIGRERDAAGRVVRERFRDGTEQRWTYDGNGNVVQRVDRDGAVHEVGLGSWNLVKERRDGLGNPIRFEHDQREKVTRVVDANGNESDYVYDLKSRLVEVHRHGVVRERYRYDAASNLVERSDGAGNTLLDIEIGRDNLKRTVRAATGEVHRFEYDGRGRFTRAKTEEGDTRLSWEEGGRQLSEKRDGLGIEREYVTRERVRETLLDRFVSERTTLPDGTLIVKDPTGGAHCFAWNPDSRALARVLGNGTSEVRRYDHRGRCLSAAAQGRQGGRRQEYAYSPGGDLAAVLDATGSTRYEHDAAHRLTREVLPSGEERAFRYDAAGNLLEQPGLEDVTLAEGNRLATAQGDRFSYNARNHVSAREGSAGKTEYEYDAFDQLVRIRAGKSSQWTASYDPFGRRTRKSFQGKHTDFYWEQDRLVAEVRSDGSVRLYLYVDPSALVPFLLVDYDSLQARTDSGRRLYVFTNQIGAPVRLEDDEGRAVWSARLDPYGQAHVDPQSTVELALRFPGHYHDAETGLFYNRYRYYSPELGRYLASDPIGMAGGTNLYAYTPRPLTAVDLLGLHPDQDDQNGDGDADDGTLPGAEGEPSADGENGAGDDGIDPDTVADDPAQLWGKSAEEIAAAFDAQDGVSASTRPSTKGSMRSTQVGVQGHSQVGNVQVHPGGGRHEGEYVKVSTNNGKKKVVDPATYKHTPGEKCEFYDKDGRKIESWNDDGTPNYGDG